LTKDGGFTRKQADPESERTFVHFILNPLYKLYSHVLSEETDALKETLKSLGIQLKPVLYKMDVRPLLKAVLDQFFGPSTGLVDVMVEHIPSPIDGAAKKVFDILLFWFVSYVFVLRLKEHTWAHKLPNSSPR
jgi:116 kDa U5 small nuclear ribonucleoprotein component